MYEKKKLILGIIVAVAIILVIWIVNIFFGGKTASAPGNTTAPSAQTAQNTPATTNGGTSSMSNQTQKPASSQSQSQSDTNKEQKKPTFMYFISASDEKFAETNKILADLQKKYGEKITFDIRNIDQDADAKSKFSINQTPTLYLLDASGDFKDMKFGFSDEATLEESIKKVITQ